MPRKKQPAVVRKNHIERDVKAIFKTFKGKKQPAKKPSLAAAIQILVSEKAESECEVREHLASPHPLPKSKLNGQYWASVWQKRVDSINYALSLLRAAQRGKAK